MKTLIINTAWYSYDTGARAEVYPKRDYSIPISENCTLCAPLNGPDAPITLVPISEEIDSIRNMISESFLLFGIKVENGEIVTLYLSP